MLHPAYKLAYFRKAGWPEEWVEEARRLITEEWKARYKPGTGSEANGAAGNDAP